MRTLVNWETVRSSPNSTPIVGFGRFPWMRNQNCSPPLSHHLDVFVLTDYHSVSALCQRSSNTLCPRYLRVRKGHSVRWMMSADPQKTTAVTQFPVPSNVAGIQRFMGMVNHLGRFIPHLADLSDPLRQL